MDTCWDGMSQGPSEYLFIYPSQHPLYILHYQVRVGMGLHFTFNSQHYSGTMESQSVAFCLLWLVKAATQQKPYVQMYSLFFLYK